MPQALERDSASLFLMANACQQREEDAGKVPSTWEQSTSSTMFYVPDPHTRMAADTVYVLSVVLPPLLHMA